MAIIRHRPLIWPLLAVAKTVSFPKAKVCWNADGTPLDWYSLLLQLITLTGIVANATIGQIRFEQIKLNQNLNGAYSFIPQRMASNLRGRSVSLY